MLIFLSKGKNIKMRRIYKFYKQRLIEISGKNRSLYTKRVTNKFSYDIGKIFAGDEKMTDLLVYTF